jgi:aspartate-semialdehyde dehydrogenase
MGKSLSYVAYIHKQESQNTMGQSIAVIGATGLVGQEIISILGEGDYDVETLHAITSKKQSGKELSFGDRDLITKNIDDFDFKDADIVFYAQQLAPSKSTILRIANDGVRVIDCSGVMTFEPHHGHITVLPSARAQLLMTALKPITKYTNIKRITVSTFEATSGEGKDGMDELFNQSRKFFVHDAMETNVFDKQIAFNVIPQIDGFMDDGQATSEWTLSAEIKKFLGKNIKTSATCVQVPTFIGHAMAVNIECDGDIEVTTALDLWRGDHATTVIDRMSEMEFVTPSEIAGEDTVFISRVRVDPTLDHGLSFWCVGDNVRVGIAMNAIEAIK